MDAKVSCGGTGLGTGGGGSQYRSERGSMGPVTPPIAQISLMFPLFAVMWISTYLEAHPSSFC